MIAPNSRRSINASDSRLGRNGSGAPSGKAYDPQSLVPSTESADACVVETNMEGTILNWNLEAERLLGYTAQEMIGKPITILFQDQRGDQRAVREMLGGWQEVERFDSVRIRKDGTPVHVSVTLSPVRDENG